jgi:SAM-dependent methyltransferase
MTSESKNNKKEEIINYFKLLDKQEGNKVYTTTKGIFGTTNIELFKLFCEKINLENYKSFLDLGSGDGRVCILANEYTEAKGVEFEEELIKKSREHAKKLSSDVKFICEDFQKINYAEYDILFSFADNFFSELFINKLKKEFKGTLFIFQGIYTPENISKGKTIWLNSLTPIYQYHF